MKGLTFFGRPIIYYSYVCLYPFVRVNEKMKMTNLSKKVSGAKFYFNLKMTVIFFILILE